MRLYHFLSAENALDDLAKGRIKLSEIDSLNDPFELWALAQSNREIRKQLRTWKQQMSQQYLLLCLSKNRWNPVLWSHYSDNHRGICFGLDVRDDCVQPVRYVKRRIKVQNPISEETIAKLINTKFEGWSYEEEWRCWSRLEERDASSGNLCFRKFDNDIALREVIVGPLCGTPQETIRRAVQQYGRDIAVTKGRLAFNSFRIVRKLGGSQPTRKLSRTQAE